MRQEVSKGLCAVALILATASTAMAATQKTSGQVCWTGKANVIATTEADMGLTWEVDFVYTSDDDDPAKSSTGKCVGVQGVVAGEKERPPHFCHVLAADGSTFMTRVTPAPDGTEESVFFGGTGAMKGISGGNKGAKAEQMKAPKGMFAGCRKLKGEHTIPG